MVYIGLGSNLNAPKEQLNSALAAFEQDNDLQLLKVSGFYRSKALTLSGTAEQNDYINAAAQLESRLSAEQLLEKLHDIEARQGRERIEKWAARTLDVDILLYADQCIQTQSLTIPHSQIAWRNFVIHPLFEIAGDIEIPGVGSLGELANSTSWDGLAKL